MVPTQFMFSDYSDKNGRKGIFMTGAALTALWSFALFPLIDTGNFYYIGAVNGSGNQDNFANAQIFNLTLGINTHLNLPSNPTVGQAGTIVVKQDGTGSRTLSYAGAWEFPGGTAPTLTTTASAEDRIDYYVVAANAIHAVATLNMG